MFFVPSRPRCSYRLCSQPTRIFCSRNLCKLHCLEEDSNCGSNSHDEDRPPALVPFPVPTQAIISLNFKDEGIYMSFTVPISSWFLDLSTLPTEAKIHLGWAHILPGTLEVMDESSQFVGYFGGSVRVFDDDDDDGVGFVNLRAQTIQGLSQVPRSLFYDMVWTLDQLSELTAHPVNLTIENAYKVVFLHEPTADDLDTIGICDKILQSSPARVREQFESQVGPGSWAGFVKACQDAALADPQASGSTRALFLSPLAYRQCRPRGKPAFLATSPAQDV